MFCSVPCATLDCMSESKRVTFVYSCGKGHTPTFEYEHEELRKELDTGTFKFFCSGCRESYLPTEREIKDLRERLETFDPQIS